MHHIAVLGGGPAGYVAASHAAAHGARVTLIDPKPLGGTCLNQGCVPTKVLVESCSLLEKMRHAEMFGLEATGSVHGNWPAINRRSASIIAMLNDGIERLMEDRGVTIIRDYGEFVDAHAIAAGGEVVRADTILVCTGSSPAADPQFHVDGTQIGTSDDLLQWPDLPRSLLIVGSGIIACEFAFILDSLGVEVTVLASGPRLMSGIDRDVSLVLQREMRKRDIRVELDCRVKTLKRHAGGVDAVTEHGPVCTAERALVAVGRRANTRRLGLDRPGIATNAKGEIVVDEVLRTSLRHVYAAGDVNGRLGLAHAASAQAKLAVDHALGRDVEPVSDKAVPVAAFTSPEIAWVGLTEEEARAEGYDPVSGIFNLRGLGRAHALGEISGFAKVVYDRRSGALAGLHIIGPHASEMVHEGAVVIQRRGQARELLATVHAHPTISEGILEAVEDAFGQATHKPLTMRQKEHDAV